MNNTILWDKNFFNENVAQEKEENNLETLRAKHREEKLTYRKHQQEFWKGKFRFSEQVKSIDDASSTDIISLAKSLKVKSQVSSGLLKTIMNGLLENKKNISLFLGVDGALQGLLRALSGQNETFQLIAARCICNLALGNEKETFQVLKAAESYLMVHLSGKNCYIIEACAMALGNFSRNGEKHIEFLIRQKFFSKIINILNSCNINLEAAAIYALTHFIYNGIDILRKENLESSLLAVAPIFKKNSFSVVFLQSILSSCKNFSHHLLQNEVHIQALKSLLISLQEKNKETVYFLRIVSNCLSDETAQMTKDLVKNHSHVLRECVSGILRLNEEYLQRECLNLLGVLLNHSSGIVESFGHELVKENFSEIQSIIVNLKQLPASELSEKT